LHKCRVGQNRIYTPYMTVYLVISLPKIPYKHRIYMVLANPTQMHLTSNQTCEDAPGTAAAAAEQTKRAAWQKACLGEAHSVAGAAWPRAGCEPHGSL